MIAIEDIPRDVMVDAVAQSLRDDGISPVTWRDSKGVAKDAVDAALGAMAAYFGEGWVEAGMSTETEMIRKALLRDRFIRRAIALSTGLGETTQAALNELMGLAMSGSRILVKGGEDA